MNDDIETENTDITPDFGEGRDRADPKTDHSLFDEFDDAICSAGAAFGMWLVAPILHGVVWPFSSALVARFYGEGWLGIAEIMQTLASVSVAWFGLFAVLQLGLRGLNRKNGILKQ